jgi:hypothetical protein
MVILFVEGEVLAERINPRAEKGNLDLRRAGILPVKVKLLDPLLFPGKILRHTSTPLSILNRILW